MSGYRKRALPFIRGVPVLVGAAALVMLLLATTSTASGAGSTKLRLATGQITPGATYYGSKSISGEAARTDKSLLGLSGSRLVPVMIKYDFDATASYTGRVKGLRATSPRVTGKSLRANKVAVARYNRYAQRLTGQISGRIQSAVPGVRFGTAFRTVYGGVAARVPANQISKLLSVRGVVGGAAGFPPPAARRQHRVDRSTQGLEEAGRQGARGPERHRRRHRHRRVARAPDARGQGPSARVRLVRLSVRRRERRGASRPDVHVQRQADRRVRQDRHLHGDHRTPFRASSATTRREQCSARDPEGHGTHTTTTAAGDCVNSAILYGVERGPVCGIAPGARVIQYRVCLEQGCFSSDSVSAVAAGDRRRRRT